MTPTAASNLLRQYPDVAEDRARALLVLAPLGHQVLQLPSARAPDQVPNLDPVIHAHAVRSVVNEPDRVLLGHDTQVGDMHPIPNLSMASWSVISTIQPSFASSRKRDSTSPKWGCADE